MDIGNCSTIDTAPQNSAPMKPIEFSSVPIGGWFKESVSGTWHLKTSSTKGAYQSWGTRYEPSFVGGNIVFVD